jgi:adenosylmethionine-8-amino-7-oxononanoate aminotransferase
LKEKLLPFSFVGDVRGKGLLLGVEIVKDKETKEPYPVEKHMAETITQILVKKGIIVYPGTGNADGINGDQFIVAPPLITTKAQADDIVNALVAGFNEVERDLV